MSSRSRLFLGGGGRGYTTISMVQTPAAPPLPPPQPYVPTPTPQQQPQPAPVPRPSPPTQYLTPPLPTPSQLLPPPPRARTQQATQYIPQAPPTPSKQMMDMSPVFPTGEPGSKDVWGPKVWRILHNMAWLSNRTDVFFIWKLILKSLSEVMPCQTCRQHLSQYLNTHSLFLIKNIHLLKGSDIQTRMVQIVWNLHNDVNMRTGKGSYTIEQLNNLYLNASRGQVLNETNKLLNEIYHDWEPIVVKQITGGPFREWRSHVTMFMSFVSAGPN